MRAYQPICMTAVSLPVTWEGIQALCQRGTTVVGFCGAVVGLAVGICSLIWWLRKLRK